jgi:hypothetical protein
MVADLAMVADDWARRIPDYANAERNVIAEKVQAMAAAHRRHRFTIKRSMVDQVFYHDFAHVMDLPDVRCSTIGAVSTR